MMADTTQSKVEQESELIDVKQLPPDLLLVIFIHGFKGTESTFGGFPSRLQHVLTESIDNVKVECIVFPAYETKGELSEAVEKFADWLTTLTVEREVANGTGGGAGNAKIVFCGHSMGGLLAADTLLAFVKSRPDKHAPLWPKIIACIAYDTPYLGLHPSVFKHGATQVVKYATDARTLATNVFSAFPSFGGKSSAAAAAAESRPIASIAQGPTAATSSAGWSRWAPAAYAVGGALIAGAAAGTAYHKRQELSVSYMWATDHMKYVGTLWDEAALQRRLDSLIEVEKSFGVLFRNFFTFLPVTSFTDTSPRTFVVLPSPSSPSAGHFLRAKNGIVSNEVDAHTGMFEAKSNDGYYELGLQTAKIVREAVMIARGVVQSTQGNVVDDPQNDTSGG